MSLGLLLALTIAAAPRLAVMPIAPGASIGPDQAASLTETLAAELRAQSGAQVMSSRDLGSLLSLEKQKQALGCTTDGCMAEIAGAAGADRLVSGDVARLGESLVVQLRLLDARSATVLTQAHRRFKKGTFDDLLDALPAMVGELLKPAPPMAPPPPPSASSTPVPAPSLKPASPPPAPAGRPSVAQAPAAPASPASGAWPPKGVWTSTTPLPDPRGGIALAAFGGKLYAFGGWTDRPVALAHVYDPASRTWRALTPMPTARINPYAAVVNGRIVVIGGWEGKRHSRATEEYDPASDRWAQRAPVPGGGLDAMGGAVLDGKVYLFGGGRPNADFGVVGSTLVYDVATDRWSDARESPVRRYRALSAEVGGKLYVIGGEMPLKGWVELFDPARNRWDRTSAKAIQPHPRRGAAAAAVGGQICLVGGVADDAPIPTGHSPISDTAECYDPAADRWIALPPLPTPRFSAGVAALDGALYVVGGFRADKCEPTVQVIRP